MTRRERERKKESGKQQREKREQVTKAILTGGKRKGTALREAGYSEKYSRSPAFYRTQTFRELADHYLSNEKILEMHQMLAYARKLDQMVFPGEMSDDEIAEMLQETGCILRKIVYRGYEPGKGEDEEARIEAKHAVFWAVDNKARTDAIDMAYKLKGLYPEKGAAGQGGDEGALSQLSDKQLAQRKKELQKMLQKKN